MWSCITEVLTCTSVLSNGVWHLSCAWGPACFLWRNVCLRPLPILNYVQLFFFFFNVFWIFVFIRYMIWIYFLPFCDLCNSLCLKMSFGAQKFYILIKSNLSQFVFWCSRSFLTVQPSLASSTSWAAPRSQSERKLVGPFQISLLATGLRYR